eukprot:TRINITY_DN12284_c0_g1_i1.p1 TRINITY_DN12284_c0_g1~~TRINITY_DN12284_c0_g1_i1.p1  ORF type:complete len:220 (+),score=37.44 TRINITY_DN12284_c0_g1_i1:34-693(+)
MSFVTIQHNDIPNFLRNNEASIGNLLYESKESGGGCKALLFGGSSLSIVYPCSIYKMKYQIKEQIATHIDETVHRNLSFLNEKLFELLGNPDTNTLSYEWNGSYCARAKLLGKNQEFFTRIYRKVLDSDETYEELSVAECPVSFKGFVCIKMKGVYYTSFKGRGSKIFLVVDLEEIVIQEITTGRSKILDLLGGTISTTKVSEDSATIVENQESEDLLW